MENPPTADLFTGRRLDILDNGSLKIQYNRNRYYDQYIGRWLTSDSLGYMDGMNLYEYVKSDPISNVDMLGLLTDKEAKRIVEDWLETKRRLPQGTIRYFPTRENCIYHHLYKLRNLRYIKGVKKVGIGAGFAPISVIVPGGISKISLKILEELMNKLAEGKLSYEEILDIIEKMLPGVPPESIKEVAKEWVKVKIGKTFGEGRVVTKKKKERYTNIECSFYVTAETEPDDTYDKGDRFSIFASCRYTCCSAVKRNCPCGCKGVFVLTVLGENKGKDVDPGISSEKILLPKN